uniref:Transmembrane protein 132D n=1 Tax=Scleropages formosus TaxID=113540 RepID=A0A8C9R4Z4_SCLFO
MGSVHPVQQRARCPCTVFPQSRRGRSCPAYQVLDADYLLLKESGQDLMRNSSMRSHVQPLVILQADQAPVINATYGPLWVQQDVPPALVPAAQLPSVSWRVQAFVLSRRIFSSAPRLRVLFYLSGRGWGNTGNTGNSGDGTADDLPCVTLYAFWQTQEVRGSCALSGALGVCVAELEPPGAWFSPVPESTSRERQGPRPEGNAVELYYRVQPRWCGRCGSKRGGAPEPSGEGGEAAVAPMQRIGSARLSQAPAGGSSLSQLKLGDAIIIKTSSKPLKKTDIASFYVFLASSSSLDKFTLRATVKKGVSFCTATPSNSPLWDTALDTSEDGTVAFCKRPTLFSSRPDNSPQEVVQLDFETEELGAPSESQVITWRLEVPGDPRGSSEGAMRIHRTQRDFVGLAPLVMDTEILNTAVLTGKKATVPVRTVAVEEDGSITDVSEFTDCRSTDKDILKVSDRCDYVFVNGKETKGRVKMAVNFTYSYLSAQLEMNVWIPRLPLQIEVSDTELSQIKGWRVPIVASRRYGLNSWDSEEEDRKAKGCTLQYQHALVQVLTHFVAERADQRGRPAYFLGRDWQVDVTPLVRYFLRVEDSRVARLHRGRVLSGRDAGVTAVQVLSPLSDSILAEKTVTVLDDKVTITELGVQLVTGLSLSLQLSPGSNRAIVATTTTQEVLQSPKQEAVISLWIQFSDGCVTPLDIYDPSYYMLAVTSLDTGVVSVQNTQAAVVAEGEGQGELVKVEMVISEECQKTKRKSTLAVGSGSLKVKFRTTGPRGAVAGGASDYGNDGEEPESEREATRNRLALTTFDREESAMRKVSTTAKSTGLETRERGNIRGLGSSGSSQSQGMEVEVGSGPTQASRSFSDLEIGMYALLGVFCLAILVFLVNCVSYVVRVYRKRVPTPSREAPGHRHDWVWLGTDAELVMNVPGTPTQQGSRNTATTIIDIGTGSDTVSSRGRRSSCQTPSESSLGDTESPHQACTRRESLNSPTSKRKRVQFTTFSSLESRQHTSTWPSAESSSDTPGGAGQEKSSPEPQMPAAVPAAAPLGEPLDHL